MIHVQNSNLCLSVFMFCGQHARNVTLTYPVLRLLLMMNGKKQQLTYNLRYTQSILISSTTQPMEKLIKQQVSPCLENTVVLHYQKQIFHSLSVSVINET